jgi:hypothetical protein
MVFVSRLISVVFLSFLCFSRARKRHVLALVLRLSRACHVLVSRLSRACLVLVSRLVSVVYVLFYVAQQRRSRSAPCNAAALEFWCEDSDVLACMSGTPRVTSWPSNRVRGSCLAIESLCRIRAPPLRCRAVSEDQ